MTKTTTWARTAGLAASMLISLAAHAGPVKTLFLGADTGLAAVQSAIIGSDARFDQANSGTYAAQSGTPSLALLKQYDSILFWSNLYPSDASMLGNMLADYVDAGGRVVRATFVGQEVPNAGRIASSGYAPFVSGRGDAYNSACLGSYDSSSAIMAGVSSICASRYRGDWNNTLDVDADLVASWDDGRAFVGINGARNVIDVSLFPNAEAYGVVTGDYRQLFANALAYDGQAGNHVPEPGSFALVGVALLGIGAARRRKA
ncbi:PEP-CTERM sorting domain-containing protein [Paucibacter sp. AS339]|uniref:PEP-CTERM sorting domain-containing protein n=1 Tax=Paucibacter hankyongi TaxID=3133434 RepID=UPI0030AECC8D